jgi:hypothetical protein
LGPWWAYQWVRPSVHSSPRNCAMPLGLLHWLQHGSHELVSAGSPLGTRTCSRRQSLQRTLRSPRYPPSNNANHYYTDAQWAQKWALSLGPWWVQESVSDSRRGGLLVKKGWQIVGPSDDRPPKDGQLGAKCSILRSTSLEQSAQKSDPLGYWP